jgi:hypothetical protein
MLKLELKVHKTGIGLSDLVLKAQVEKDIYNKIKAGSQIRVRYAKEDPCIALIEGEF